MLRVATRMVLRVDGGGTIRTVRLVEPLSESVVRAERLLMAEKDRWERSEQYIGKTLSVEIEYE